MQGVTVKNEIVEREIDKSSLIIVLSAIVLTIGFAVFVCIKCLIESEFGWGFAAILCMLAMVGYARTMWKAYNNTWPEYIVEVDKSVNFNQFMSKYEVVDKEKDNLYRVRTVEN